MRADACQRAGRQTHQHQHGHVVHQPWRPEHQHRHCHLTGVVPLGFIGGNMAREALSHKELFGGVVLILMGCKILLEHLGVL